MRDAATDLILGGACVACERPGRSLCRVCAARLPDTPFVAWPAPAPAGLAVPWAAADYAGAVRALVLAHKEHGCLALARPLGRLLAGAVAAALAGGAGPVVLVPVPSRRSTVRSRGHDATHAVVRHAAGILRAEGHDALARPMLVLRPGVLDQSGLDARARAANLAGSMLCPTVSLRRLAARRSAVRVVLCDDVLTTGATAGEGQRALSSVGLEVSAVAVVAATRRRLPPPGVHHGELSGGFLSGTGHSD